MAESAAVIVLEFNELSSRLVGELIDEGELPNFARLRDESTVMITDPEAPQSNLNPWVQWPTVHTGVSHDVHGIEKLGEADRLRQETMGEVVERSGRPALICGAMNVPHRGTGRSVYLPDPWNPSATPEPADLRAFADFVRSNVQEHTNESARPSPASVARFGAFMVRRGLSPRTVSTALRQLVQERRQDTGNFARACVLDRLQWDVFRWYARRRRPALATFFSNSTAHFQHLYWRYHEPDQFSVQPSADEQRRYGDAVRLGYRAMDGLVAEAVELADELGATLMMCTALSQQPYLLAEEAGGKFTYRPRDFRRLLAAVGVTQEARIAPVMAEQFHVLFDSSDSAGEAADRLQHATVEGEPAVAVRVVGDDLLAGCRITWTLPDDAVLVDADGGRHLFHDLFYRFETSKSGYHHPDGMWWVRTGRHAEVADRVPLRAVAPMILRMLKLDPPGSMTAAEVVIEGLNTDQ